MKRDVKIQTQSRKLGKDREEEFISFATGVAEHILNKIGLEHSEGTATEDTYRVFPFSMKNSCGYEPNNLVQYKIFEWMYEFFSQYKIGIMINGHLKHISPYTVKRVMWGEDLCESFYLYPNKAVVRMLYEIEEVSAGQFGDWIEANKEA